MKKYFLVLIPLFAFVVFTVGCNKPVQMDKGVEEIQTSDQKSEENEEPQPGEENREEGEPQPGEENGEEGEEPQTAEENGEDDAEYQEEEELIDDSQESEDYFYHFFEKIFVTKITDKICLKFSTNFSKDQILSIISSDASLQMTSDNHPFMLENNVLRFAILETKDGKPIPLASINSFKERDEVVSAEYLYQYRLGDKFSALLNEFVVLLDINDENKALYYEQFYKLAKENNCIIGEEDQFVKNKFMITVLKESKINAMQMANLFYETGLFVFSAPNFLIPNAFDLLP